MRDEVELTPEEKMAFEKLPREASPSDLLEERIVRTLREDGILRTAAGASGTAADVARIASSRWRRGIAAGWGRPWLVAAASMAASLILFGSGVFLGQWMGARSAERLMLAVREQDNALLAQRVQETGSAYARALAALAALRDSPATGARGGHAVPAARVASELQQGSEAALGALYAAALELVRLAPDDPDVAQILEILEDRRFAPVNGSRRTKTMWY